MRLSPLALLLSTALLFATTPAVRARESAAEDPGPKRSCLELLDNEYYKLSLDIRARLELADQDGLDLSQAWTVRTRAGIGTRPIYGFSGFAELENTLAIDADDLYWDAVGPANGRTAIADPPDTQLNRSWLQYQNDEWWGLLAKGGRQRIVLDDARFVGDVGWRQNEQTFGAALGRTSFGQEGLRMSYAYLWEIHRIFGDEGGPATRDWDSDSHLFNLQYAKLPGGATLTAFAYLLDFQNAAANSSNSYGLRLAGSHAPRDGLVLSYSVSYAYQTDAANNPVDYGASYAWVEGGIGYGFAGALRLGFELLGSDDGKARFVTPLATAHKFNGFADVFLNNGGPNGLRDAFVSYVPVLPFGLKGFVTYHHFWSDENPTSLGNEIDFVLARPFGEHFEVLAKGAYFLGTSAGPPDVWRYSLQISFSY